MVRKNDSRGTPRRFDPLPNLGLVSVRSRGVDVLVPVLEARTRPRARPRPARISTSLRWMSGLILMMSRRTQRTEPEHGHLRASVKLDGLVNWHCVWGLC